jgi:hypothetical protein
MRLHKGQLNRIVKEIVYTFPFPQSEDASDSFDASDSSPECVHAKTTNTEGKRRFTNAQRIDFLL